MIYSKNFTATIIKDLLQQDPSLSKTKKQIHYIVDTIIKHKPPVALHPDFKSLL